MTEATIISAILSGAALIVVALIKFVPSKESNGPISAKIVLILEQLSNTMSALSLDQRDVQRMTSDLHMWHSREDESGRKIMYSSAHSEKKILQMLESISERLDKI